MDSRGVLLDSTVILLTLFSVVVRVIGQQGPIYTVIAPKVIRPHSDFHVSLSASHTSEPLDIALSVLSERGEVAPSQSLRLDPSSTRTVVFELGDLPLGKFNLTARGVGGYTFYNTTELIYVPKSLSVFIQTDKPTYQPGERVMFRVLIVNPLLKPEVTGSIDVLVTDGRGNLVRQWPPSFTTKGVFQGDFHLSDEPVPGNWNVSVNLLGQHFTKQFFVAEFILPDFDVSISLPPFATFTQPDISALITARYRYGKAVKGEAKIRVSPLFRSQYFQPFYEQPHYKSVQMNGKTEVPFSLVKDLQLKDDDYMRDIMFEVVVTEAVSGRSQNASGVLTLFKFPVRIELIRTSDSFKPGLQFKAFIKVLQPDGSPINDGVNQLFFRYSFNPRPTPADMMETGYWIPADGLVEVTVLPPIGTNASVLVMEAEYQSVTTSLGSVNRAQSPSNTYMQLSLQARNPKVNDNIRASLNATVPIDNYVYQVMGRGDIVFSQTVSGNGQLTTTFSFPCIASMAPSARILVYMVLPSREVVADALDFDVEGVFQNEITLSSNIEEAQPGRQATLTVRTKRESLVGLMGIDQRIVKQFQLGSKRLNVARNDISQSEILAELQGYDPAPRNHFGPNSADLYSFSTKQKRSFFNPGAASANDVFRESGVAILTNGNVYQGPLGDVTYQTEYPGPRPDLAGPYAFSRIPRPATGRPQIFVSDQPHATWLFETINLRNEGEVSVTRTLPDDTRTSWIVTAFSIHPLLGLTVTPEPLVIRVSQDFYISLNLPNHILFGESVALIVTVFNSRARSLETEVRLENLEQKYNFIGAPRSIEQKGVGQIQKRRVNVPASDTASVTFTIQPKETGYINIRVSAISGAGQDSIERKLYVKPAGWQQYINKVFLVDLTASSNWIQNVTLDIPKTAVKRSVTVQASGIGDLMGPAITNAHQLLRLPTGCGEQNLINLVPNIIVMKYLETIGQVTTSIRERAVEHMETGYQRQLAYRRKDNSFSTFGDSDSSGSTFLTAYVVKSLIQAEAYIPVDKNVILKALTWLAGVQSRDGDFPEVGKVFHSAVQTQMGVTAYVVNTLHTARNLTAGQYSNALNRALSFLAQRVNTISDLYTMAVVCHSLHVALHPSRNICFKTLERAGDNSTNEMLYWKHGNTQQQPPPPRNAPWIHQASSFDIEMTSYMLMIYVERGMVEAALPIVKWLLQQRNSLGGFASSQDTVIGLEALAAYGSRVNSDLPDLDVTFVNDGFPISTIYVTPLSMMQFQKNDLPATVRSLSIRGKGRGRALMQVSYMFNLDVTGAYPSFRLDPQLGKGADKNRLQINVCTNFLETDRESNMVVMDISLPSGFTVDRKNLPSLRDIDFVRRVETRDSSTGVVIYFDKITKLEVCPTILAYRTFAVADQKPVPVVIMDYYNQSRYARVFYHPYVSSVCDICEGETCENVICDGKPGGGNPITSGGLKGDGNRIQGWSSHWVGATAVALICVIGAL